MSGHQVKALGLLFVSCGSLSTENSFSGCLPGEAQLTSLTSVLWEDLAGAPWPPWDGGFVRVWELRSWLNLFPLLSVILFLIFPFLPLRRPSSGTMLCGILSTSHPQTASSKPHSSQATLTWWRSAGKAPLSKALVCLGEGGRKV